MTESPQSWNPPGGDASIELLSPRVIRIVLSGRVDAAAGKALARTLGEWLSHAPAKEVFWDLHALEGYASEVRTLSTQALLANRKNVASIKVIARSRIVKMGVSVANVALGGRIQQFDELSAFQAALRVACKG